MIIVSGRRIKKLKGVRIVIIEQVREIAKNIVDYL